MERGARGWYLARALLKETGDETEMYIRPRRRMSRWIDLYCLSIHFLYSGMMDMHDALNSPCLVLCSSHLPLSHSPERVHAACTYTRSHTFPKESSAGRASRCMAIGERGSADFAL